MHVPVLAAEALEWLAVQPNGVYVDCTAGAGGHASLIAERLTTGRLIALDRDLSAVELARERLKPFAQAEVIHANYGELATVLSQQGIRQVDGVLIDAGLSSMQLDTPERGFSLQDAGPLDMRMDASQGMSAADYLAGIGQDTLANVLKEYGDVTRAGRIARTILEWRDVGRLNTTADLARAVSDALGVRNKIADEAYTVFQAIRIAVNDELRWLAEGVEQAIDVLAPGGRFVGITFHSGEDRIVKNILRTQARPHREFQPDGRLRSETPPRIRLLTKKPIRPSEAETRANPRARSARLRAAERLTG